MTAFRGDIEYSYEVSSSPVQSVDSYYDEEGVSDNNRIVNGYDPLERPWQTLIIIKEQFMCGGALINHQQVYVYDIIINEET